MCENEKGDKKYCGPYYMPYKYKKFSSYVFNMACKTHDISYSEKNPSRFKCDLIFLKDMFVTLCKHYLKAALGTLLILPFFIAVFIGGGKSYGHKEGNK